MNSVAEIKGKADGILVTAILFVVLSGIAVGLRLYSRAIVKLCFGLDDWTIITALLLFYAVEGLEVYSALQAQKANTLMDLGYKNFIRYEYIEGTLYYFTVMTINISTLSLYRRIFDTAYFRRISLILIFINIAWCIPGTLVEIFICTPIRSIWDFTEDGKCIKFGTFWVIIVTAELLIDIMVLLLPIREIAKLQICWKQKCLISMMFLLGGLVIVTGIVRIPLSYNPDSPAMIDLPEDALWLNIHLGAAIICACLPTYRPLFRKGSSFLSILRRRPSSHDDSAKESGKLHHSSLNENQNGSQASYQDLEGQKKSSSFRSVEFSTSSI